MTIRQVSPRAARLALAGLACACSTPPPSDATAQAATPSPSLPATSPAPFPDGSWAYGNAYGPMGPPPVNTIPMLPSSAPTGYLPGDMVIAVPIPAQRDEGLTLIDLLGIAASAAVVWTLLIKPHFPNLSSL